MTCILHLYDTCLTWSVFFQVWHGLQQTGLLPFATEPLTDIVRTARWVDNSNTPSWLLSSVVNGYTDLCRGTISDHVTLLDMLHK